jgi:hypothetical protein
MEPYEGDRFRNAERVKRCGVRISHHFRPIVRAINDDFEHVKRAIAPAMSVADVICIGGLRPDPGISLAWQHAYGLEAGLLPKDEVKALPTGIRELVINAMQLYDAQLPIVERSSEAISFLLDLPEYNLYRFRPDDSQAFLSVPRHEQEILFRRTGSTLADVIRRNAQSIGLANVKLVAHGDDVRLGRHLSYQEHRLLLHSIGHSAILS